MSDLKQIFYCNVGNICWDTYGNTYPIKTGGNWKHINVDGRKVGVSTLSVKVKIFNFDDFVFWYVFGGLCQKLPCPAMGYYVYQKMTGRSISLVNYFKKFSHIEKIIK